MVFGIFVVASVHRGCEVVNTLVQKSLSTASAHLDNTLCRVYYAIYLFI